jgi:hypothetical protein
VDSDWLFSNFLQLRAFRSAPSPRNPSLFSAELPDSSHREAPLQLWANLRQRPLGTGITKINEKTDLNISLASPALQNIGG